MRDKTKWSPKQWHEFEVTLSIMSVIFSAAVAIACAVFWDEPTGTVILGGLSLMMVGTTAKLIRRGGEKSGP